MKKIIAIILVCLFTANICGASVSYHYCGKILQYFAFNGKKQKSKCCCGGTQRKRGCCKTEHYKVKIDEGKSFAKQLTWEKQFAVDAGIPVSFFFYQPAIPVYTRAYLTPVAHGPPLPEKIPLHVLYQCFLI